MGHDRSPLNEVCEECPRAVLVCIRCKDGAHKSHACKPLGEFADLACNLKINWQIVKGLSERLLASFSVGHSKALEHLTSFRRSISEQLDKVESGIPAFFEQMSNKLGS